MITKYFPFLFIAVFFAIGCHPCKYCKSHNKMLVRIDTAQPHKYWGKMCVASIKDTLYENSAGMVCFNIFDGVTGRRADDGVIWFDGTDTLKLEFSQGQGCRIVPKGIYDVTVTSFDGYSLSVVKKKVKIENNRIDFRCYLGRSLQF